FSSPLRTREAVAGWIYLGIHIFVMGNLLVWADGALGLSLDTAQLNFVYYLVGFVFVMVSMFHFLKESFSDLCDNFLKSVGSVILGYAFYYLIMIAVTLLMTRILPEISNPNANAVNST